MKLSPRHEPVIRASIAIQEAVISAVEKYGLTFAELVSILGGIIVGWTRMEIQDERQS